MKLARPAGRIRRSTIGSRATNDVRLRRLVLQGCRYMDDEINRRLVVATTVSLQA